MSPAPEAALDAAARAKLQTVLELLAEERASVSSVVDQRAWQVHVVDSLTGLEVPALREAGRIADIGAGAGFPGLVLAVALPEARVDLIESVGRKYEFMRHAIETADIPNATVLHTRSDGFAGTRSPLQVGAEVYGHSGAASELEILRLVLLTLELAGIGNAYLDLGHVGIYRGLARQAGLTSDQELTLFETLQRKAIPEVAELIVGT